jgi:diguanylate cyclase
MGKHAAVLDPISFAVWYDYAAGGSLELKSKLDALIAQGGLVSQNLMRELFLKYVVHPESDPALEVLNQVLGLTQAVSKSTAMAREANAELGRSLSTFENRLSDPPGPQTLGNAVDDMRQASAQTQESIQQVSAMLAQHSGEIERLRGELQQAKEEASLDGLTQVLNRRAFDRAVAESLNQEMPTSGHHPCLLLLDVDNFKLLNDGFGHAFGDEVLRALARVLRSVTAAGDSVGRFGGDEFALLLCVHTLDEARAVAESLRKQVANARVRVRANWRTAGPGHHLGSVPRPASPVKTQGAGCSAPTRPCTGPSTTAATAWPGLRRLLKRAPQPAHAPGARARHAASAAAIPMWWV